jgi:hypothetical protein
MGYKQITLIAGHDTNEEREELTLDWLRKHNVTIEDERGLLILTMRAELVRGQHRDEYVAGFDTAEGNQEASSLTISLEPDPYETRIYVEFEGSYSCTCKGRGCVKCNEELEAIEAGRNPYAHHTVKSEPEPRISPHFQDMMDSLLPGASPRVNDRRTYGEVPPVERPEETTWYEC